MSPNLVYIDERPVRRRVYKILAGGGVVVLPTDTLYGLSSRLSSREGYERIIELKMCGGERNFLLLADSVEMVSGFVASWGCSSREELEEIWPAPLTAILPAGGRCPDWAGDTIALRIPDFEPLREIIGELGEPIISTSANLSGRPPLHTPEEIMKLFGKKVDLIVARKRATQDLPSTIVDFTKAKPHLIRVGSYPW
jgi:L-threonylcarbamoyladenylate synthase